MVGGDEQGLRQADAAANGVLNRRIAGGVLERVRQIRHAASERGGDVLQLERLGVVGVNIVLDAAGEKGGGAAYHAVLLGDGHLRRQHEQRDAERLGGQLLLRRAVVERENLLREIAQKRKLRLRGADVRAAGRNAVIDGQSAKLDVGKAEAVRADFHVGVGHDLVQLTAVVINQIALLNHIGEVVDVVGAEAAVAQQQLTHGVVPVHRAVVLGFAVVLPVGVDEHRKNAVFEHTVGKGLDVFHGHTPSKRNKTTR